MINARLLKGAEWYGLFVLVQNISRDKGKYNIKAVLAPPAAEFR